MRRFIFACFALLALGGHYAGLWARQSGGFLEAEA